MLLISTIAQAISAQVLTRHHDFTIKNIFTDSRHILNVSEDCLFIALRGSNFNGNMFFNDAYEKGIRNFIIDETIDISSYPNTNILLVANTIQALQQIATAHRTNFKIPIIGITGSNGKTVVKEWLSELLHQEFNVVKSPGSFNSQVGVPLSVWQIGPEHTLGIFEAGISKPGEMLKLERIIKPTIGVLTNLGDAHNEGFLTSEDKLKEKLLLFKDAKTVVLNHQYISYLNADQKVFSWSKEDKNAHVFITALQTDNKRTTITYRYNSENFSVIIPFEDDASIENAITCLCICLLLNMTNTNIARQMLHLHPVQMRLALQRGNYDNVIINDAYSADINSLRNALSFMKKQLHQGEKVVVISDFLQSGKKDELLYKEIAGLFKQYDIKKIYGIGKSIGKFKDLFGIDSKFFEDTPSFVKAIVNNELRFNHNLILLKGARKFYFEKIAQALSAQHHTTCLEIDLNAIAHNFHTYKKLILEKTKVMVMVKAFSYGSGSNEIAALLQFHKADYLAVAYADEGVVLRNSGVTLPIMVMNTEEKSFDLLMQYNLEPVVYAMKQLQSLVAFSNDRLNIHLEFETGMHRLGLETSEVESVISLLQKHPNIQVKSVFSHLASAEEEDADTFTHIQIEKFNNLSARIQKVFPNVLRHLLNSAGITRWADKAQFDMVRLGIGLYGIDPSDKLNERLLPASTLKSTISQIKHLVPGDGVSYNRRFVAEKPMRIATIPIGYADGLNRGLGNGKGLFYIQGKPAIILGTICMDMTMVDITEIACEEGDEVIVFGGPIPVKEVASMAKTISYEILSTLSQRIKRVYIQE